MKPLTTTLTRRPLRGLAAATGAALLLLGTVACGSSGSPSSGGPDHSYTDAAGRAVTIPTTPKRVVTLAEGSLDAALALGVTPVGTTSGRGQSGIPDYLAPAAKGAQIPIVASTRSPNLGQILKVHPDLIVVDDTTGSRNSIDDLAKIAPTILVAKTSDAWEKYFAQMAQVLNRPDEHHRVLAEITGKLDAAHRLVAAHPGGKPLTASVVRWTAEGPTLVGGNSLSSQVLRRVGIERPAAQEKIDSAHRSGEKVSMEKLDLIDADYIFFGVLGSAEQARAALQTARTKPGFDALGAAKAGHVIPVDGAPWTSGTGPLGVEAILRDITGALS